MELTPFDSYLTNDFLQIIKIMIPYLPPNMQRMIGIYIKITELSYIMAKRKFPYMNTLKIESVLSDIEPYLPENSRKMISEFQQIFEMFDMMQNMDFGDIDISDLFQFERSSSHERMDESSSNEAAGPL